MVLRLILLRHAKSSWSEPGQEDRDRVLNKRGRRSAAAIGKWLFEKSYLPDEILCSTAARTVETLERLDISGEVVLRDSLYLASSDRMMEELQRARSGTVMMIGHNPGIGDFAERLVVETPPHGRFADYPTCATLIVDFDAESWPEVRFGTGRVQNFITPRELVAE